MSAIKLINANEGRRDPVASDRTTVYTDGYKNLFTAGTTPSIADILVGIGGDPSGTIPLSNVHVPGTDDLMLYVNGQLLLEPGVDFTEVGNQKVLLSAFWIAVLTADPVNSKVKIIWNRALPGARDQLLQHLQNCPPDIEGAILDNSGSPQRAAAATAANPLTTFADLPVVPASSKIFPVSQANRLIATYTPGVPQTLSYTFNATFLEAYPVGVTHAVVRVVSNSDPTGGPGDQDVYLAAYTATPVSIALPQNKIAHRSFALGLDVDGGLSGWALVELNSPRGVADITVYSAHPSVQLSNVDAWVIHEAYIIP